MGKERRLQVAVLRHHHHRLAEAWLLLVISLHLLRLEWRTGAHSRVAA